VNSALAIPQSVFAQVALLARAKWRWFTRLHFVDAEDIAQEALLRLWKTYYRHGFEPAVQHIGLIVKRTTIDLLTVSRTTARHQRRMDFPEVPLEDVLGHSPDGGPDPTQNPEQVAHIARWYATLGERDQHIVRELITGYPMKEIGEQLGITEARVSQIVKEYRQQLRTHYGVPS